MLSFIGEFNSEFIGQLAFKMQGETFSVGENVIMEGEDGDKLFFISTGKVCVLHRETHTYLDDLHVT